MLQDGLHGSTESTAAAARAALAGCDAPPTAPPSQAPGATSGCPDAGRNKRAQGMDHGHGSTSSLPVAQEPPAKLPKLANGVHGTCAATAPIPVAHMCPLHMAAVVHAWAMRKLSHEHPEKPENFVMRPF